MPHELRKSRQPRKIKSVAPPRKAIKKEKYELPEWSTSKEMDVSFEKEAEKALEARAMPLHLIPGGVATILERVVYKALYDLGFRPPDMDFQSSMLGGRMEWRFGRQVADIAIDSLGLVIEVQGEYWHQYGEQPTRDLEREMRLEQVPRMAGPWRTVYCDEWIIRDPFVLQDWLERNVIHAGFHRQELIYSTHRDPHRRPYQPPEAPIVPTPVPELPALGKTWISKSPVNLVVNGGFEASTTHLIGWTTEDGCTATVSSGKASLTATVEDKGIYQQITDLLPKGIYTLVCKVNTLGYEGYIYTTEGNRDISDIAKTGKEQTFTQLCQASDTGTLTIYLACHTTGQPITYDDVALFRGHLAFPYIPNPLDAWRHPSNAVYMDGGDIYAHSVTADKVNIVPSNLVANPGFEAGSLVEWTSGGGSPAIHTTNVHAGGYSCAATGNGADNLAVLSQPIKVEPGRNYYFGAWVKNSTGTGAAGCYVVWLTQAGASVGSSSGAFSAASTSFAKKSAVGTAPATAATARLTLTVRSDNSATVYFDDVEFYPTDSRLLVGDPAGARVEINADGIEGYDSTPTLQFWIDGATGKGMFGGGAGTLDEDGLTLVAASGEDPSWQATGSIKWSPSIGGLVGSHYEPTPGTTVAAFRLSSNDDLEYTMGRIELSAYAPNGLGGSYYTTLNLVNNGTDTAASLGVQQGVKNASFALSSYIPAAMIIAQDGANRGSLRVARTNSATAPMVSIADDLNTGIWQSAADNLDFSTGGTNRLNISSAGLGVAGAVSATTSLISGINGTAAGMLTVYGPGASNTEGGQIDIYPGSSYQSVISKWSIDVYADDLRFFGTGGTVNLLLKAEGPVHLGHAGTALLPALTLNGDANTGIYHSAADNLDFSTGGVRRLNISSAGLSVTGDVGININNLRGQSFSLADDTVFSWTPSAPNGILLLSSVSSYSVCGVIHWQVSSGYAFCFGLALGSNVVVGSGALTNGTTNGIDGKVNVHTHTDGKIYVKNRMGGSYGIRTVQLAG